MRNIKVRILLAAMVLIWGVIYSLPSFLPENSPFKKFLPNKKINLGLDLKGGINLILGIDMDTALKNTLDQLAEELRQEAKKKGIILLLPRVEGTDRLSFYLVTSKKQKEFEEILHKYFRYQFEIEKVYTLESGRKKYVLKLLPEYKKRLQDWTVDQALKVIRTRVDQFGVVEPDIRKLKNHRIQVQLPGLKDANRAIKIIRRTAHLEFKLVDDDVKVEEALKGNIPPDDEILYMYIKNPDGTYTKKPIVVKKRVLLTGEYITDASVAFDSYNQPYVILSFNRRGARIFERITGENVNKRLAIILDNKVYSAPVIREKIVGGRASITGRFTVEEAHDLAIVLRAGSLPAPIKILQETSVGPSLGQQSIQQGIRAMVVGSILVFVFMIIYYGLSGAIADLMLIFNLILILGTLACFGATLTLPGIAGLILLVGMAVDANVLIYERIRENLNRGLDVSKAVDEGFSRSTLTIFDANITTILAAIILYEFGTGPIKGFAVTLSIGIVASMFTAIFVSKIFFDIWISKRKESFNI